MAVRVLFTGLLAVFGSSLAQQPEVTTSLGTLKGLVLKSSSGREYLSFEGIPFAKPPAGKHRFKQAVPSGPWTGVLNATRAPPICMQQMLDWPPSGMPLPIDVHGSEDCLYLNVYRPKLTAQQPSSKLLNVIVAIHGGAYQIGFGTMYGPSHIMDRDVVLVSLNYRVGILGFLSFEDSVVPGNNGLKDQALALQWVKKHIAAFGGDPNKVTINGVSAGGSSVDQHMISPMSKGLFHKAISNSGSALNPWALQRNARETGLFIAESVGCPINDTNLTLKCLRERTAEQIIGAVNHFSKEKEILFQFSPVIEPPGPNAFMDKHPIDMIKSKAGSDVPALFSYAIDEGATFLTKPFFDADNAQAFDDAWNQKIPKTALFDGLLEPKREEEVSQLLRQKFLGAAKLSDNLNGYSKLVGERYFDDGIQKSYLLHAENQKSPVYSYRFNYNRPKGYLKMFEDMFEKINYKGWMRYSYKGIPFLYTVLWLMASCGAHLFYRQQVADAWTQMLETSINFSNVMFSFLLFSLPVSNFFMIYSWIFELPKIVKCYNKTAILEKKISDVFPASNRNKIAISMVNFFIALFFVTLLVIGYFLLTTRFKEYPVYLLLLIVIAFAVHCLYTFLWCFNFYFISDLALKLRKHMLLCLQVEENCAFKLKTCRKMWISIWKQSQSYSHSIAVSIGYSLITNSIVFVIGCYGTLSSCRNHNILEVLEMSPYVGFTFINVAFIFETSYQATGKLGNEFLNTLVFLNKDAVDRECVEEIEQFVDTINHTRNAVITLKDYMTMDRTLLISFLSNSVTYLIVLVQFQNKNQEPGMNTSNSTIVNNTITNF